MNKMFSIIIPIYNGEKYIRNCLESIFKQTYLNYEIILINDGSTDKTSDILEEYQENTKIKVINQINQGVSNSRNNGLALAKGDYIIFIDVDDQISKDALKILNKILNKENADIIRFNGYVQDKKMRYKEIEFPVKNYICYNSDRDIEKLLNLIISRDAINCYTPLLAMRNSNIVKFNNNLKYLEDKAFYLENFTQKNKKILFVNEKLYYYNYNVESKTKNKNNFYTNILDIIESYNYINEILKDINKKFIFNNKESICSLIISRIDFFSKFLNYPHFKQCILQLKKNTKIDEIFDINDENYNYIRKVERRLFKNSNILMLYLICEFKAKIK